MAINKILCIGGQGMLGRPVVRRLLTDGFSIRLMARNVGKVQAETPEKLELFEGDLRSIEDISRAAEGMEAVYLNLATNNPNAAFKPELDGTRNVVEALKGRNDFLIAKLSGLNSGDDESWMDSMQKAEADKMIIDSGHPYLLFGATWFMESLPVFINKGRLSLLGNLPHQLWWIAGDDYGKMVSAALKKGVKNRVFKVQGPNPLTFKEAAERFITAYNPEIKLNRIPLWMLAFVGMFKAEVKSVYQLMRHCKKYPESEADRETWEELYKPQMTVEDYVDYMKMTKDIPRRN